MRTGTFRFLPLLRGGAWLYLAIGLVAALGCAPNAETLLKDAKNYAALGEHRAAEIELKTLLQSNPDDAEARYLLGRTLLITGDHGGAETELRRALSLGATAQDVLPDLALAMLNQRKYTELLEDEHFLTERDVSDGDKLLVLLSRGEAYLGLGSYSQASAAFEAAAALEPKNVRLFVGLSRLAAGNGDYDGAHQQISEALQIDATYIPALITLGTIELAKQEPEKALVTFGRAEAARGAYTPMEQRFRFGSGIAESQIATGDFDQALSTLDGLQKLVPNNPTLSFLRARSFYGRGDYEDAKDQLAVTLNAYPDHIPSQALLGSAHYALGEFQQADLYLAQVLDANPENSNVRRMLAAIRLKQDLAQEASDLLEPIGAENDGQLLVMRGVAAVQSGDIETGLGLLERAAAMESSGAAPKLQIAYARIRSGDYTKAIEVLNDLPSEGTWPQRSQLMIMAWALSGDNDNALSGLNDLHARADESPELLPWIGDMYLRLGDRVQGQKVHSAVLENNPESKESLTSLAAIALAENRLDEARGRLTSVLDTTPDYLPAILGMADLAKRSKQPTKAVEWLTKARSLAPKSSSLLLGLGQQQLGLRNFEAALKTSKSVLELDEKNANGHVLQALSYSGLGDLDSASRAIRTAVRLDSVNPQAHLLMGRIQASLGDMEGSGVSFARAYELDPQSLQTIDALSKWEMGRGNRQRVDEIIKASRSSLSKAQVGELEGDLLMISGEVANAEKRYAATLAEDSNNEQLAIKSYMAAKELGEPARGLKQLSAWADQDTRSESVRFLVANEYMQLGDNAPAIKRFSDLAQTNANNAAVLNNLAWLYHLEGDKRAVETAEKAYDLTPGNPAITDTLGWILVNENQTNRGLLLLTQASKKMPDDPEVNYHLAVALQKTGEIDSSKAVLQKILDKKQQFGSRSAAEDLLNELEGQ